MSDMTQSFIEMVEAFKAKPELEAKIDDLTRDNAMCYGTIDQLRFEIETLKSDKSAPETKLVEVTKERDDASFRNLELDEKLAGIEKLLGVAERLEQARQQGHQAGVDSMTPKPEPAPEPALLPTDSGLNYYSDPLDIIAGSGQSESLPTIQTPPDSGSISETGSSIPTEPKINPYSGFPIHYPDGEYKGQPYYDKPSWVSWAAWVDAGGEAEPWTKNFG